MLTDDSLNVKESASMALASLAQIKQAKVEVTIYLYY